VSLAWLRRAIMVMTASVVLGATAAGAGTWYAVRNSSSRASRTTVGGSLAPAPPSNPPEGVVSLASVAALRPEAPLIEPVIAAYFRAINRRDYAGYLATQSPGDTLTAQQFRAGFRSTQDSGVLITSIATAPDGRPAADVTFTSRQQPQDGPDGESCTSWHLTMFFDEHGRSYTIGAPPGDYHAAYQACS
jgi:hypothetical protein